MDIGTKTSPTANSGFVSQPGRSTNASRDFRSLNLVLRRTGLDSGLK